MIYLDTHIVVWLHAGLTERFQPSIRTLINSHDLLISPIVRLELQYLHEIGRITPTADTLITALSQKIGLIVCTKPFNTIITAATELTWTRDPFDRILVAHANLDNSILITKDHKILDHYAFAKWE